MNRGNFFAELKRRNVYKVAVAYLVSAWLVVQVATQVLPLFEIPIWVLRLLVVLLILGFPTALILAWAFEITPEGIEWESEDNKRVRRKTGRKLVAVTAVLAVLAAGLFLFQTFGLKSARKSSPAASPSAEKSIAVLPFENLSRDPDNAYFTEGVQDEILMRLAKVADLKVISRLSTQRYKSAPDDLPQIARELGVAHILEGSVQKAGDQVRVTVKLINAVTNAHVWGESFDRKLTDIFAVESEIAKIVSDRLQARLSGSEKSALAARPTESAEAHQLYLRGRYFWNKRTGADLKRAVGYFEQAIAKDPKYALAHAGLADAYVLMPGFAAASPQESLPKAKVAARKALELDETLGEAHAALGLALFGYDLDFEQANQEFRRAIQLSPNYATAHHWYGQSGLTPLRQFDEAIAEMKRALELDPLSVIINADLGNVLFHAHRYDEAIEQLRKTLEMEQNFYYARWNLGQALEMKGFVKEAIAEYEKTMALDDDPLSFALLAHLYAKIGQKDEAHRFLQRLRESSHPGFVTPYYFVLVHAGLGENDEAMRFLEKAFEERDGFNLGFIRSDPMLDPLRDDPRFQAFVAKIFGPR